MPKTTIQPGAIFSRLTVVSGTLERLNPDGKKVLWSICRCVCGKTKQIRNNGLLSGQTRSCGCLHREWLQSGKAHASHGHTQGRKHSSTYRSWVSMIDRCTNPQSKSYPYYGKRGISICERWLNSFDNFLADMGVRPVKLTLERVDNYGNYEPSNCIWATRKEQAANKRAYGSCL